MTKRQIATVIMSSLFISTAWSTTYAAEQLATYELDQFLVTAQKYEKKDVDIAASTQVITQQQLEQTGATNLQQALGYSQGLVYQAKGPGGAALGTMTSSIAIRGVDSGTLVLVNGSPINLRGLYNLQDIPVADVERVEVIRGGGSVLYGSEAMGGVINIITKKKLNNYVSVGVGNFGQQSHAVSVQAGKLGINYSYDKWGSVDKISRSDSDPSKELNQYFKGSEKHNLFLTYQINDKLDINYTHNEATEKYDYLFGDEYSKENARGKTRYFRDYNTKRDFVQVNYQNANFKLNTYFNTQERDATGMDFYTSNGTINKIPKAYSSYEKNTTYGLDTQNFWNIKDGKVLVGGTYQHEKYYKDKDYSRNNLSIYAQLEKNLSKKNTFVLSARESLSFGDRNFNNFSAQGQFIHKLNDEQSLYASVGQSFKMPTLAQMYSDGSVIGDPNLKPQVGTNYEIGWKKNLPNHKWRIALFKIDIKDNISFTRDDKDSSIFYAKNEDFKNIGIEAGVDISGKGGWSYNYGITIQDPQSKESNISGNTAKKPYWDRVMGRVQLNAGIAYHKDKLSAALNLSYLAARVLTPSSSPSKDAKPYLLTGMSAKYDFDKQSTLELSVENLFNRKDIITHTSSEYYSTPTNFMLNYKLKF